MQLDWSKCEAAECLRGETGNVWVIRGTDAPLSKVLRGVADGLSLGEVAEIFEVTEQQLMAIVRFATMGGLAAGGR
jgi:hypothetical protein